MTFPRCLKDVGAVFISPHIPATSLLDAYAFAVNLGGLAGLDAFGIYGFSTISDQCMTSGDCSRPPGAMPLDCRSTSQCRLPPICADMSRHRVERIPRV